MASLLYAGLIPPSRRSVIVSDSLWGPDQLSVTCLRQCLQSDENYACQIPIQYTVRWWRQGLSVVRQCLESDENNACQIPIRYSTQSDGDVKVCLSCDSVLCLMRNNACQIPIRHNTQSDSDVKICLSYDCVLSLMRIMHARFLSDTTHCPMVRSKSVCRATVSYVWWE